MTHYFDIARFLDYEVSFQLPVRGLPVTVTKVAERTRDVHIFDAHVGSFRAREEDRAAYYASEIANEPGITNWISDDVTSLISRMIDLRD